MQSNTLSKNLKCFSEGTVPGKRFNKIFHNFVIDKYIFEGRTDFQDILIFENSIYGRILVLDGIVQLSEADEFIYHEMITHPYILSHPDPKKILIIGGGDGGTLRECLKHFPKECTMVDIDKKVIDYCREYMPVISDKAFESSMAEVLCEDGKVFMKKKEKHYDIIIIDCNDPVGPSVELFTKEFYIDIKKALAENGICSFQMGSFLDLDFLQKMHSVLKEVFKYSVIYRLTIPSYHCGEYCFMGVSDAVDLENIPLDEINKSFQKFKAGSSLKYYSPEIHKASQMLPKVMRIK